MTRIPTSTVVLLKDYFRDAVSMSLTPNQDILTARLTVEAVERLCATRVHLFTHKKSGAQVLRADNYSLPRPIGEAIYVVGDLVQLPQIRIATSASTGGSSARRGPGNWSLGCTAIDCIGLVTPAVLMKRYSIGQPAGMDAANNSMAVAEFGAYYRQADLDLFSEACDVKVTVDHLIGENGNGTSSEANLDIEVIRGVSPGIALTVINSKEYSLLDWMVQINSLDEPPWVHSLSYGGDERQYDSADYMLACNIQLMKVGVRGVSVFAASGDFGVCGREDCGPRPIRFQPDFPASSPFVTSVGGTDFKTYNIGDEIGWAGSGGGFSDIFSIPNWQAAAVAAYKASPLAKLPETARWNNTGRGYPDLAALGGRRMHCCMVQCASPCIMCVHVSWLANGACQWCMLHAGGLKTPYCTIVDGAMKGAGGTSASAPVVAGIFARLNGLRLASGRPTLGFVNPLIYLHPEAFNDVTVGCNNGGFTDGCFTAIVGWDPVTGLGTPNFLILASLI
jgi:tripeptidyl-peptidase-1